MRLKIINSNSTGNAYILQPDEGKSLLIECGVQFDKIQKALNFNLTDKQPIIYKYKGYGN